MTNIRVSTVEDVLERFRQDIVAQLRANRFDVPADADVTGAHSEALTAWVRLQHRGVPTVPRTVLVSKQLQERTLELAVQSSLATVKQEFERGDDLTHRLTRQFYKAGFNDFLFNTFGIHHIHLGAPGAGRDRTKQHVMSGGDELVLFVVVKRGEAYFIDVLGHHVFKSAQDTEYLVQVVLRNWGTGPLERYVLPGASNPSLSFAGAFHGALKGFTTLLEVDGVVFAGGTVFDGKVTKRKVVAGQVTDYERAACTSFEVAVETDRILDGIVELVEYAIARAEMLAGVVESRGRPRPGEIQLEVARAGRTVVLQDQNTGLELFLTSQGSVGFRL